MTATELWDILGSTDAAGSPVSPDTARVLLRWYDGNPYDISADRVASALDLFRWVRSAGALEYLPKEVRQKRIGEGAAQFGVAPDRLVRLIVSADELLFDRPGSDTRSLFVALEGIDSSGKTTQMDLLFESIRSVGRSAAALSFPRYETFLGRQIRGLLNGGGAVSAETVDPRSMALWYALDRWSAFRDGPPTADVVFLNRYSLSNAVYQSARVDGPQADELFDWVLELEHRELGLPTPDVTIVLDVPASVSETRSHTRSSAGERSEMPDVYERSRRLLTRARELYLRAAERLPNVVVVKGTDAGGEPRSTSDIHDDVLRILLTLLT